jgi:hypothetical protein
MVFDEAVYAKIQQVRWKTPEFVSRFVVRLGEFHTSMSYMSAIGKRISQENECKDKVKKTSAKTSKGEVVQITSEYKFWVRLLLIAKHRYIDTKDVLRYCLRPYPAQFATTSGSLKLRL